MACKCAVPNCKGNYKTGSKVTLISFPKEKQLCQIWTRVIKRDNYILSKSTEVSGIFCIKNKFNLIENLMIK